MAAPAGTLEQPPVEVPAELGTVSKAASAAVPPQGIPVPPPHPPPQWTIGGSSSSTAPAGPPPPPPPPPQASQRPSHVGPIRVAPRPKHGVPQQVPSRGCGGGGPAWGRAVPTGSASTFRRSNSDYFDPNYDPRQWDFWEGDAGSDWPGWASRPPWEQSYFPLEGYGEAGSWSGYAGSQGFQGEQSPRVQSQAAYARGPGPPEEAQQGSGFFPRLLTWCGVPPSSPQLKGQPVPPRAETQEALKRKHRLEQLTAQFQSADFAGLLQAVRDFLQAGDPLPCELLAQLLEKAAGEGNAALVDVLTLVGSSSSAPAPEGRTEASASAAKAAESTPRLFLDVPSYAWLMKKLTLDPTRYRPTVVRLLLNLAMPQELPIVPLVPPTLTQDDELRAALLEGMHKNAAGAPLPQEDKEESSGNEEEEAGAQWPEELVFRNCQIWPQLNGAFRRTRDFDQLLPDKRPTYERSVEGSPAVKVLCFYKSFPSEGSGEPKKKRRKNETEPAKETAGWWLGTQVGGLKGLLGSCPGSENEEIPPGKGWLIKKPGTTEDSKEDHGGFVSQEDLGIEALQSFDLSCLRGRVEATTAATSAYFGHFCCLLHLEYLVELAAVRSRVSRRDGAALQRTGWALTGLRARDAVAKGKGKGKGKAGKGGKGKQELLLTLHVGRDIDPERLRFRKGDSVMVSNTDPLIDKLGEGNLQEITDGVAVIALEGLDAMPPDFQKKSWRIDKGTNRLSYSRQLDSLVALCVSAEGDSRPKIFELITSGRVGKVDAWAEKLFGAQTKEKETTGLPDEALAAQSEATNQVCNEPLVAGDSVVLHGLKAEELNNLEGQLLELSVPGAPERASVRLQDGSVKAVKLENLRKIAAPSPPPPPEVKKPSLVAELAAAPAPAADQEALRICREDLSKVPGINKSQEIAICAALERRCTVIQGPPGTGKTTTAVQALRSLAKLGFKPLLATADGNIAVDNIAEGLANLGVKVVRVGRPEKIRGHVESLTLDAQLKARREVADAAKADAELQRKSEARAKRLAELEQMTVASLRHAVAAAGLALSADSLPSEPLVLKDSKKESEETEPKVKKEEPLPFSALDAVLHAIVAAEEAKALEAQLAAEQAKTQEVLDQEYRNRKRELRKEDTDMMTAILKDAEVICTQMISAGGGLFHQLGKFQAILVDEVAQATELGTIVPIVQRGCERLVLTGDHYQLPPTVQSPEAERRGLTLSLYGRLVAEGLEPFFLDTQFRSHPKLAEWSAEVIYEGRLRSGIAGEARPLLQGYEWPKKKVPVAFIEAGRDARESDEGESKSNREEAERVLSIVEAVLDAGELTEFDVGVVTPYMAQVRLIRTLWRETCARRASEAASQEAANRDKSKKKRKNEAEVKLEQPLQKWWTAPRNLEIASVDNFQGREKELIIFSAVRNNAQGRVGFLADWRRLNVMLTRARRGLLVVGNAWTLRFDPFWSKWLDWCEKHGVVVDPKASHDILSRALRSQDTPQPVKRLLKQLFQYDRVPQGKKAFTAFASTELEGGDNEAQVQAVWETLVHWRAQAAESAVAKRTERQERRKAFRAAAEATANVLQEAPGATNEEEPSQGDEPPWEGWLAAVQKFLEQQTGPVTWRKVRGTVFPQYRAACPECEKPIKTLFRELRESVPANYWLAAESEDTPPLERLLQLPEAKKETSEEPKLKKRKKSLSVKAEKKEEPATVKPEPQEAEPGEVSQKPAKKAKSKAKRKST